MPRARPYPKACVLLLVCTMFAGTGCCFGGQHSFAYEDNVKEHFNFGYEFYLRGEWHQALVEFTNVSLLAPDSPLGPLWCGICHRKLGNQDEAVQHLLAAVRLDSDNKDARRMLEELGVEANGAGPGLEAGLENPFEALQADETGTTDGSASSRNEEPAQPEEPEEVWAVMRDYLYQEGSVEDEQPEPAGVPEPDPEPLLDPEIVEVPDPAPVEREDQPGGSEEPQDWYANLDQCKESRRIISLAISLFNIDHMEPMTRSTFSLPQLLKEKYLDHLPVCPSGGIYSLTEEGEVTCSVHY